MKSLSLALTTGLASLLLLSACDNQSGTDTPTPTDKAGYTLVAAVGEDGYMTHTDNLMTGKVTILGKGIEDQSYGSGTEIDGYLYSQNFNTKLLEQYKLTTSGLQKMASISITPLTGVGYFRDMVKIEDGKLLCTTWPYEDGSGKVDYAILNVPAFTVQTKGSFTVAKLGRFQPVEIGGPAIVSGDKIYLGSMYTNIPDYDRTPDSLLTWQYDYPSFTNPKLLVSRASLGVTNSFSGESMIKDEKGDIYQSNIRSKHWYNMGIYKNKPAVVTRIRNGAYDDSYVFNISEKFNETVSLINYTYVGNGIAYGKLHFEDRAKEWLEAAQGNTTAIVKLDFYNKTVTQLNLPLAPYINVQNMVIENGNVYVPVSPKGEKAYIYELDPTKGADGFTRGAELDGNNITAHSLYKTPVKE